jgi:L-aspartate semialdehyde sulfurtransferase ferredoxin
MASRRINMTYPEHLIKEPLLFRMARQFDLVPNIRRARITETVGEMTLELEGDAANIAAGIKYLEEMGVEVEPLEGDIVAG